MRLRLIIFLGNLVARWRDWMNGGEIAQLRREVELYDGVRLGLVRERDDAVRQAQGFEILLAERGETVERLEANAREDDAYITDLEARCVSLLDTADALEAELVRRQLGAHTDPDAVLVVTGLDEQGRQGKASANLRFT